MRVAVEGGPGAPGVGALVATICGAGLLYGACMGLYGWMYGTDYGPLHVVAASLKMPFLLLATLLVTAPSLHVVAALARSTLEARQTLRALLTATAIDTVVLASLAPVTAFFTMSTRSHPFMQLLNGLFLAVGGLTGLVFLWRGLIETQGRPASTPMAQRAQGEAASERPPRLVLPFALKAVLAGWCVVYAGVGAQMAWLMRPFVGTPSLPQELFRAKDSNFLFGLFEALEYL
jgi:hypothetical protein